TSPWSCPRGSDRSLEVLEQLLPRLLVLPPVEQRLGRVVPCVDVQGDLGSLATCRQLGSENEVPHGHHGAAALELELLGVLIRMLERVRLVGHDALQPVEHHIRTLGERLLQGLQRTHPLPLCSRSSSVDVDGVVPLSLDHTSNVSQPAVSSTLASRSTRSHAPDLEIGIGTPPSRPAVSPPAATSGAPLRPDSVDRAGIRILVPRVHGRTPP